MNSKGKIMSENTPKEKYNRPTELEEAVNQLKARARRIQDTVVLPVMDAHGCILADDILATHDQPPFARSPFDGYALRSADSAGASKESPVSLKVIEEADAGDWPKSTVGKGEAVRIMTGAPIPEGADSVIKQEETDYGEDIVMIYREMRKDQNYIFPGEDYKKGSRLLEKGDRLGPVELGIIASCGLTEVKVFRRPVVAVISTGSELANPGEPLSGGKIYDSNGLTIAAQLEEWGCAVCEIIRVPDIPEICTDHIKRLKDKVDLIVTSGGVSVGKKDIMHDVFAALKIDQIFWKVGIKPGAAILAGEYDNIPVLALSGNPYAAYIDLHIIVRHVLSAVTGNNSLEMVRQTAVLEDPYDKPSPIRRFVRCYVQDGKAYLEDHIGGNGDIAASRHINAVIDIPAGSGPLVKGNKVNVMLL